MAAAVTKGGGFGFLAAGGCNEIANISANFNASLSIY